MDNLFPTFGQDRPHFRTKKKACSEPSRRFRLATTTFSAKEQANLIGVELLVEIQFLARQGVNKSQIARRLGVDRKTVRKYLAQDADEFVKKPTKWPSILAPYRPREGQVLFFL
jgi:DNA-binding NtrC family response regulator